MKNLGRHVLREGLFAGVIGYAVIVIFFIIQNLIQGRSPFHTAALLGATLFFGLQDPAHLQISAGPVLAYNGVHLIVLILIGIFAAWLAAESERGPQFWFMGISLFGILLFHMLGAVLWFAYPLQEALSSGAVVLSTGAGAAAMVAYLWAIHPGLRRGFHDDNAPG